jgi:plasmid stabilization system protein ParE
MTLRIQRSEWFLGDLEHYAAWYDREASWELAESYLRAVAASLTRLAKMPGLGHRTFFSAEGLRDLRCWPLERPFQKHLIFYRSDDAVLYAERIFHGARNLPIRLIEPPG